MTSQVEEIPASIPPLDAILKGSCESAAVTKFLEVVDFPAMILGAQDESASLRFLHVNRAFTSLCGYQPHEALGETTALLQGDDTDIEAARKFRREVEREGKAFTTLINYRKDGTPYEVFILGAMLRDNGETENDAAQLFSAFAFFIGNADYVVSRTQSGG